MTTEMTMEKIRVVAGAAVTWIAFAAGVCVLLAGAIGQLAAESVELVAETFGASVAADVSSAIDATVAWLSRLAAWLTGVVVVIRRHTPVPPSERGILPPPPPPSLRAAPTRLGPGE